MIHNFGSRYARKPIKGSKDSDDSLVSKKNWSEKIGSLDWHLGPGEVAKNTPTCDAPAREPKTKKNFFSWNWKTCRIRRWFEHLSSPNDWWVMELQKFEQISGLYGQISGLYKCYSGLYNK